MNEDKKEEADGNWDVSRRAKFVLIAWALVVLLMAMPMPGVLLSFWMFPMGLGLLMKGSRFKFDQWGGATILGAWACYLLLSVAVITIPRRNWSLALYVILCLVLVLNVVGCHEFAAM